MELYDLAENLRSGLADSAAAAGWVLDESCLVVGEPTPNCDSIHVWAPQITPLHDGRNKCHLVSRVTLRYWLTHCIGAETEENCEFWDDLTPGFYDDIWGTWEQLISRFFAGTLFPGSPCESIQWEPLRLTSTDGGVAIYEGSVVVSLASTPGS